MNDDGFRARIGQTIAGKWQLERLIGVGGMAAVYAARHRVGAPVAIKILHPEVARDAELRQRFEREALVMGRLAHPGSVDVRDIDVTADGAPYIVMELLEGESLKERAQRLGGVPAEELLGYADEALDVLAAAHDQGIVHRDIKPDNLFITTTGALKVLDFGIARMREGAPMTMVGTRLGTLPYMPPEQVRALHVDHRADIFALGAVMFRILAKRRVHEAKTESDMLIKMSADPAPPLASVAPHLPAGLCAVVDCALAFAKGERYESARAMQADVRALRAGRPPTLARPPSLRGATPTSGARSDRPSQPTRIQASAQPSATAVLDEPPTSLSRAASGASPALASRPEVATPFVPPGVGHAPPSAGPASGTGLATPFVVGTALGMSSAFEETAQAPVALAPTQCAPTDPGTQRSPGLGEPTRLSAGVPPGASTTALLPASQALGAVGTMIEAQGPPSMALPPPATISVQQPPSKKPILAIAALGTVVIGAGLLALAYAGESAPEPPSRTRSSLVDDDDAREAGSGDDEASDEERIDGDEPAPTALPPASLDRPSPPPSRPVATGGSEVRTTPPSSDRSRPASKELSDRPSEKPPPPSPPAPSNPDRKTDKKKGKKGKSDD